VKGRPLAVALIVVLAMALAAQSVRWRDRLLASELVNEVEVISVSAATRGSATLERVLPGVLAALRRAGDADPLDVEVPLARGSLYYLLRRPDEAIASYRSAAELEPHAEILLHLGDALLAAGRQDEARRSYRDALRLAPWLWPLVPAGER
jgi:tetratricopeptide (TPR) repeat protein